MRTMDLNSILKNQKGKKHWAFVVIGLLNLILTHNHFPQLVCVSFHRSLPESSSLCNFTSDISKPWI